MSKGIYAAASAMRTEQYALDVLANNLANAESPGFRQAKLRRVGFAQLLQQTDGRSPHLNQGGGAGIAPSASWTSYGTGSLKPTEQPFDVALSGAEGFFQVETPDGQVRLTRAGNFKPDSNGVLRDPRGNALLGQGGPITIPEDVATVTIDGQGIITTTDTVSSGATQQIIDQIRVVQPVAGPRSLQPVDGQYFAAGEQELDDLSDPAVRQGFLETSNGNTMADLVQMIAIQRRYDGANRVLNANLDNRSSFSDLLRGTS